MNAFCTIITQDYVGYAHGLRDSLKLYSTAPFKFYIFVACKRTNFNQPSSCDDTEYLFLEDLCSQDIGRLIRDQYFDSYIDGFRWSMKPVLITHLLRQEAIDKVLFLDVDLNFYSDYSFLMDLLDDYNILLSPHFRSSNPRDDYNNYILQFTNGLFNGGFVGANKDAIDAMNWWAARCYDICEKNSLIGQYVDQTHLNLMPVFFEKVYLLKHRGCNVANWNQTECRRVRRPNGDVFINDEFPIVFIHFTASTIRGILNGEDSLLMPHLEQYSSVVKEYYPELDIIQRGNDKISKRQKRKPLRLRLISKLKHWLFDGGGRN